MYPERSGIDTEKFNKLTGDVLAYNRFEVIGGDVHNPGSTTPQIPKFFFKPSACRCNFKFIINSIARSVMAIMETNTAAVALRYKVPFQSWLQDRIEHL
jgi:hypothetical protein